MAVSVFHTRAGRFVRAWFLPSGMSQSLSQQAQPFPLQQRPTTNRSHTNNTTLVGNSRRRQKSGAEAGQRAFAYCGGLGGVLGFPPSRWACTPPLRLTSIPLNVPLTEASAHL